MRRVKSISFSRYVDNLCLQKKTFIVESKRNLNSLYINNKFVLLTKNENNRLGTDKQKVFRSIHFFGQVQAAINRYLKKNKFCIEIVQKRFNSSKTDKDKWNKIGDGEIFYYIDIKQCFWNISYKNGLIGKNLFERIVDVDNIKFLRHMSLSLIIAPRTRKYYKNGELTHEITEDKRIYKTIYDNIRFTSYNLMGDCMVLSKKSFIAYRTDGIMVDEKAVKKVTKFIANNGYDCTVRECCKIDDRHYVIEGEEKKLF